jgi:hypothetical protein
MLSLTGSNVGGKNILSYERLSGSDSSYGSTGTDVQGYAKRTLSDDWVPAQLWVVNHGSDGTYTIQNTNSRTYLDLRMLSQHLLSRLLLMNLYR